MEKTPLSTEYITLWIKHLTVVDENDTKSYLIIEGFKIRAQLVFIEIL